MHVGPPRDPSDSLLTRPIPAGPARVPIRHLLVGDGVDAATARRWCAVGDVFALFDLAAERPDVPLAAVVLDHPDADTRTVLAVVRAHDGTQLERRLLGQVLSLLRARGVRSLVVDSRAVDAECRASFRALGFRPVPAGASVRLHLEL
ncbi:MAG: hypothetical protein H0U62_01955 [Actinobacteria bacterium]|nr:hypothetical protein [Actinomycetota bacterium]